MDRGMDEAEKSLKELEKEITCSICLEHYTQPKVLPCLHYYCKQCILKLALRTGKDQPLSCPECRKKTILPENADKLQTAFFVNRFKELYAKQKRALSKEEVKCEICTTSQVKAEAYCKQCEKFICEKCIEAHLRMKAFFDGHEVLSLNEVKKVGAKDILNKGPARKCQVHDELLKIFCFDCNQLICLDCTVKDHRDHDFEFKNLAATNKRKELMESLKPLREVAASLSCGAEKIQSTERELTAQGVSVADKIENSFEEFHSIIEARKQLMLEEVRRRVNKKMDNLQGQKKIMSICSAEVQSIIDYTEQCVQHCSDDEVMCVHAEIGRRIMREIEQYNKLQRKLTPVEDVDVGVEVRCAEALKQLLQTQTIITQLPVSLVIDTVSTKAEVGKLSEVIMCTTKLFNNKPSKRPVQIDCHMKCLHSGSLIKLNFEESGADQYRIQFTPTLRGRHELTVSFDGHQVAGSPFPVLVPIPPAQLDQPVKVWDGLTWPKGITVNSMNEVIVADFGGDVVVLDKGKRLRSVNHSEHQFQRLTGIAVDSDDNIYFNDEGTNRIFKSNKNCSKVQVHRVRQVKGPGHNDVAVVGDEVMVTERGNEGRIMVYDRELKYVRQIAGTDKRTFWGLSLDSHQNVYVSILKNCSVQVFSNDGVFLRSFGCDENGVKRLGSPWGVCVTDQYVYVADDGVQKIVVFTTGGDYVTSFGDGGWYDRVCVDQDGFVYASRFFSKTIYIY